MNRLRRVLLIIALLSAYALPLSALSKLQGYVEQGGMALNNTSFFSITRSGAQLFNPSSQQSYPNATVTVYLHSTLTLATLYSSSAGAAKSNPFAADSVGFWFFYVADGRYDVRFSGGGILAPYTLSDIATISSSVSSGTLSVKDYGAVGDGITDDTTAINATFTALSTSTVASDVYFPEGTYIISSSILFAAKSGSTIRGAGPTRSIIRSLSGLTLFSAITTPPVTDITVSDLGFSSSSFASTGISAHSTATTGISSSLTVRNCRFMGIAGLSLASIVNTVIDGNLFHGLGKNSVTGIDLAGGARRVSIRNNRFLYCRIPVILEGAGVVKVLASEYSDITSNYFDGAWWGLVEDFSGSGGTVTYTATVLTDTSQTFSGIDTGATVRTMVAVVNRTATSVNGQKVTDSGANFSAAGVRRGYILRTGSAFAFVSEVESATALTVEEWLSDTDRTPVTQPAAGSYTIYSIIEGSVQSFSATTITVARWIDLTGAASTPSAGTRYEVCKNLGNGQVLIGRAGHELRISNNSFRRAAGDQIQVYSDRTSVIGNTLEDGQDVGIAIDDGVGSTVVGNTIRHQGTQCINLFHSSKTIVSANHCEDAFWVPNLTTVSAGIAVQGGSLNIITGNWNNRIGNSPMWYGIVIYSEDPSFPANANVVTGNFANAISSGIGAVARGANVDNTLFFGNQVDAGTPATYDTGATNTRTNATGTTTWDPPPILDGVVTSTTVAVRGARLGDPVSGSHSGLTGLTNFILGCAVTNVDQVTCTLLNKTGGALDVPPGTLRAIVRQP